ALKKAIFSVFEKMFFLFPEEGASPCAPTPDWQWVTIELRGTTAAVGGFRLEFGFPPPLGREMAVNFLGLDEGDLTDEIVTATLHEAVNVVAGNLLSTTGCALSMGLPEKLVPDSATVQRWAAHPAATHLLVDEYSCLVLLRPQDGSVV
ncbi:MAG TPA: hypothetical protein PKK12_15780, partial [Candidatus Aminicenantes bacterium]|nr:hypothetical protein [Candidatus Aminicenantes bacterium]